MFWVLTAFRVAHILMAASLIYRLWPETRRSFTKHVRPSDLQYALFSGFAFAMLLFVAQGIATGDMPDARSIHAFTVLTALRCLEYAVAIGVVYAAHKVRTWAGNNGD